MYDEIHYRDDSAGRGDDSKKGGPPEHVRARDEAMEDAFAKLASCGGRPPEPLAFGSPATYAAAVECDCCRELFGTISDWRPPFLESWRSFPESDQSVSAKQISVLLARLRPRTDGSDSLVFVVEYGGRYGQSPELDAFGLFPRSNRRRQVVAGLIDRARRTRPAEVD
eukprot:6882941-Prymnesium_polylepis.1